MTKTCPRCHTEIETKRLFCACGAAYSLPDLRAVRLMGPIGVAHSNSPKIEEFFQTGDPAVFDRP